MAMVWPAAISPSPRKFVAIVMADECRNADGTSIYPSLQRIAIKAGVSQDQARRHLQALVEMGVLEVERLHRQHYTTSYRLRFDVLQGLHVCDLSDRAEVASVQFRGRMHAVQGLHERCSASAPVPPYPKGNPKGAPLEAKGGSSRPPAGAGGRTRRNTAGAGGDAWTAI